MTTLREDLLPVFDDARTLIDDLGLRTSSVTIRVVTWTGGAEGPEVRTGTPTVADLVLSPRPRVRFADSGTGLVVDKITPTGPGGIGYTPAQLNPAPTLQPGQEVYYVVDGPEGEHWYAAATIDYRRNFGYTLHLTGLTRPVPY